MVRTVLSLLRAQVQSLVRELRSQKPRGAAKKKNQKTGITSFFPPNDIFSSIRSSSL